MAAARRVYSLLSPWMRVSKLLPAFPCSPGVSLSHGFCEQAVTGKDFHHCTRPLALPKSAVSAPIIVPTTPFTHRSVFVYCHGFPAGFELVTDDKCEKSLLKKMGPSSRSLPAFCQCSIPGLGVCDGFDLDCIDDNPSANTL